MHCQAFSNHMYSHRRFLTASQCIKGTTCSRIGDCILQGAHMQDDNLVVRVEAVMPAPPCTTAAKQHI